jgi:hypothetical protein
MPSAAQRARSLSTTKEPRKPLPPVTTTRLSRQKVLLSGQLWFIAWLDLNSFG